MSCDCCQKCEISAWVQTRVGAAKACGAPGPEEEDPPALHEVVKQHVLLGVTPDGEPVGEIRIYTHPTPLIHSFPGGAGREEFSCPSSVLTTEPGGDMDGHLEWSGDSVTEEDLRSAAADAMEVVSEGTGVLTADGENDYSGKADWWRLKSGALVVPPVLAQGGASYDSAYMQEAKVKFIKRGHPVPVRILFDVVQFEGITPLATEEHSLLLAADEWETSETEVTVTHGEANNASLQNLRFEIPAMGD